MQNIDSWRSAPDPGEAEGPHGAFWQEIEASRGVRSDVGHQRDGRRDEGPDEHPSHHAGTTDRSATSRQEQGVRPERASSRTPETSAQRRRSGRRSLLTTQAPVPPPPPRERAFADQRLLDRLTLTGGVKAERQLLRFQAERRELKDEMVREAEAILAEDRKYRQLITKAVEGQGAKIVSDHAAKVRMQRNRAVKAKAEREAFNSILRPTYGRAGRGGSSRSGTPA